MESQEHIKELLSKFLSGNHTPKEYAQLLRYFDVTENESEGKQLLHEAITSSDLYSEIESERLQRVTDNAFEKLQNRIHSRRSNIRHITWVRYVAAILLFISISGGLYVFIGNRQTNPSTLTSQYGDDVAPGSNRATLTLADGSQIDLSESEEGILISEKGIQYEDGSLVTEKESIQATVRTPKAGQYSIVLADGTKVWLNAATTLKYPSSFKGKERVIELEGEAYFEVAKDPHKPFKVVSRNQIVEVLGTAFNINSYENYTATTLVHGSVSLTNEQINSFKIKPNQQAIMKGKTYNIKEVDVTDYTAWKDGLLIINTASINEIAKQIERWYDVEITISDKLAIQKTATIIVNKNESLAHVMKALQETYKVKVKIQGRRVMINEE